MISNKQQTAYSLRLPRELRGRLNHCASGNKRSLHAELLARLEASLQSTDSSFNGSSDSFENVVRSFEAAQRSLDVARRELALARAGQLVRLRAIAGMTQHDLARASGVSIAQVARYETGVSTPRNAAIVKLAKALNVSTSDLA